MSQEFFNGGQDFSGNKISTDSGKTGGTVMKTGLYKASDGKMEFIELLEQNQLFPPYPGGNGTAKCTWTRMTTVTDGSRTSFDSVKVEAGTL
jgi:hypothetical protein